ncbi:hypothetical protein [Alcanivorax sp. DP30]|uniref:hypothetical protein n=1 Tax=Alcanivorax sp. DP30 TaxID=2606217 RepID=UPI00136B0989|nr:hypothetical protein [Alcanivorax sp. DP30]MZR62298.1 hypothetical protein [Alcanivorax sp. DP30]
MNTSKTATSRVIHHLLTGLVSLPSIHRSPIFAALLGMAGLIGSMPALAAPGDLDTSFGEGGISLSQVGPQLFDGSEFFNAIIQDINGNIVAVGHSSNGNADDFSIARYTSEGQADVTFGDNGIVLTDLSGSLDQAYSVIEDSSGKLVVAGVSHNGSDTDFALARYTSEGQLDTSFGDNGIVITDLSGSSDQAYSVIEDGNGKLVVAGHSHNGSDYDFSLARYTSDGQLDTSFGNNGIVITDLNAASRDTARSLIKDDSGNLIVAGSSRSDTSSDFDFALVRYTNTGQLDSSFGDNGIVITDLNATSSDIAQSLITDDSGKLIAAGSSRSGTNSAFALVRYTATGQLDTGFGTNGKTLTDIGGSGGGSSVIQNGNGDLVVAGSSNNDFALARYTSEGQLDASFGDNGMAITDISTQDSARSAMEDANGNLVLAGFSRNSSNLDFTLASFTSEGQLNTSFGDNGIVITSQKFSKDQARSIITDSSGKLIVAGHSYTVTGTDFALARYLSNGEPDTSFGSEGAVITDISANSDYAKSVIEDSNGNLVVAGYSHNGSAYDFALVRYTSNGELDTSFGDGGLVVTDIGSNNDYAHEVIEDNNGNLVVVGYTNNKRFDSNNYDFVIARYTPAGELDTTFGEAGITVMGLTGNDYAHSVIEDSNGNLVIGGRSRSTYDSYLSLARFTSNGIADTSFGGSGAVTTRVQSNTAHVYALIEDHEGNLVVTGKIDEDFLLARYTGAGTPDTSFGTQGIISIDAGLGDTAWSVIEDLRGNLVVAGYRESAAQYEPVLLRYTHAGAPDGDFGVDGIVTLDAPKDAMAYDVVQNAEGHYVIAGHSRTPSHFMLARVFSGQEDSDEDGIRDDEDNCPLIINPDQLDTPDGDGIGNACDPDRDDDGIDNDTEIANGTAPDNADSDGDGSDDNLDAFPNDPTETTDSDGDNVGDNTDAFADNPNASADTDGDGFPEDCSNDCGGLTPDPSPNDADNDGLVDSEDKVDGDNNPPEVTAPADIELVASGDLTTVDLGTASAYDFVDGNIATVTPDTADEQTSVELPPGRHIITWSASDEAGNTGTNTQVVDISPLARFSSTGQTVGDGSPVILTVELNGDAVSYPVRIPVAIDVTSTATGDDHDAAEAIIEILEDADPANTGTYEFVATDDGLTGEADETVIFNLVEENSLDVLENAALDDNAKQHTVTITELNVAPLISTVTLNYGTSETVLTGSELEAHTVIRKDQDITLTAGLTDANPEDSHTYSWMINGELQAATGGTLMLNPMDYEPGEYSLSVQAVDDANPPEYSNTLEATLTLKNPAPTPAPVSGSSGGGGALHWLWLLAGFLLAPRLRSQD